MVNISDGGSGSGFNVGDLVSFPTAGMTDNYQIISFTTDGTFVNILDLNNNKLSQVFVSFLNSFGSKSTTGSTGSTGAGAAAAGGCLLAIPIWILSL
jgi:hypothetical protein